MVHNIKQPSDFYKAVKNGTLAFEWDKHFGKNRSIKLDTAQKYIDSECIEKMVPYTPMLNGVLFKSPVLGTKIGTGEINQIAPYARCQYYGKLMVSSVTGSSYARKGEKKILTSTPLKYNTFRNALAGKMWFERMKADHKEAILRGACLKAGGVPN